MGVTWSDGTTPGASACFESFETKPRLCQCGYSFGKPKSWRQQVNHKGPYNKWLDILFYISRNEFFCLLHCLLIKRKALEPAGILFFPKKSPKKIIKIVKINNFFRSVELQKYNTNCSNLNFWIISMHDLIRRDNKCMIICIFLNNRGSKSTHDHLQFF